MSSVRILGALHIPPHPIKIPDLMAELIQHYQTSQANPVKKIAQFHLHFERIHPFIDGNGRAGRLIANLELMKAGYPPIDIKFTDRAEYYDCFTSYEKTKQTDQMEKMMGGYVLERIEDYLKIIKDVA